MDPSGAILAITLETELTEDPIVSLRLTTPHGSFLIMAELQPATTGATSSCMVCTFMRSRADRTRLAGSLYARS